MLSSCITVIEIKCKNFNINLSPPPLSLSYLKHFKITVTFVHDGIIKWWFSLSISLSLSIYAGHPYSNHNWPSNVLEENQTLKLPNIKQSSKIKGAVGKDCPADSCHFIHWYGDRNCNSNTYFFFDISFF